MRHDDCQQGTAVFGELPAFALQQRLAPTTQGLSKYCGVLLSQNKQI